LSRAVGARLALALGLVILTGARASAQTAPPTTLNVNWGRDIPITAGAVVGVGLAALIPVSPGGLWQTQLLPFDERLKGRFSESAAKASDVLAAVDVVTPLGLIVGGGGFAEANTKRLLVYGQALALSVFANSLTKVLVGRPRPYMYSDDPRVKEYAARQGTDTHLSLYSGHASTTFTAAVAGSYLYAQFTSDKASRAFVWGFELALAAATADLRTRAGKHFYSDVIFGAIIGAGVGFCVPYLHGGPAYHPSAAEWAAIAASPVVGVVLAQLMPLEAGVTVPLGTVALPWVAPGGGGVLLARRF
jgi:membrane-associated phospholipid phosphatase